MNNYRKLNNLYRAGKYTSALNFLLSIDKEEVFLIDERLSIDDLLYKYFVEQKKGYSVTLEEELSKKFPEHFIKAIRVSQVFIDKNRLSYLKEFPFEGDLEAHIRTWEWIQREEEFLWNKVQDNLKSILEIDIHQVLIETIFWLETERYDSDSKEKRSELADIYNVFIKLYLHHSKQITINDSFNFSKNFLESLLNKLKNNVEINVSISKLLSSIGIWLKFKGAVLDPYCFDFNVIPKLQNGKFSLSESSESYAKWLLDGDRYDNNILNYQEKAGLVIQKEIENNELFIPGNTDEDIKNNLIGAVRLRKMKLFLEDLSVFHSKFRGQEQGLYKMFEQILGFSYNSHFRYELKLDEFKKTSKNWFEAYFKLFKYYFPRDIKVMPYVLISEEEYVEKIKKALPQNTKPISNAFSYLSYEVLKDKEFDRFGIGYEVSCQPFIKLGNLYFSPMLFFANNDWFYASGQVAIKYLGKNTNQRNDTSEAMEKLLGYRFEEKDYIVKVINCKEAGELIGDVDVIVEDENTTLFIQLKRPYFRLNPKDAYFEFIHSDRKASQQLNKVEGFFNNDNSSIYKLTREPVKWIVSTSFEGINSSINSCVKINYFDILFALENKNFNSLKEFISYLEENRNLSENL